MHRLTAAVLCLCLMFALGTAAAGYEVFAPQWQEAWLGEEADAAMTLSVQLAAMPPFLEDTLDSLNRILSHCGLTLAYQRQGDVTRSRGELHIGYESVVRWLEEEKADGGEMTWSTLPEQTYRSGAGSPLSALLGAEDRADVDLSFLRLAEQAESMQALLTVPGTERALSKKFKNVGTAKSSVTYTLTQEEAGAYRNALCGTLTCRQAVDFLRALSFDGKIKLVFYRDADSALIAVAVSGKMGRGEDLRKADAVWSFSHTYDAARDTVTLKSPAVKGNNQTTLTLSAYAQAGEGEQRLEADVRLSRTLNKVKIVTQWSGDMTNDQAGEGWNLTGEIKKTETVGDGDKQTLTLTPKLTYRGAEAYGGTLQVRTQTAKRVTLDMTVSLDGLAPETQAFTPMPANVVDLTGKSPAEMAALEQEVTASVVNPIVKALMALPEEDLKLLSEGLTDEAWKEILQAANQVAGGEV